MRKSLLVAASLLALGGVASADSKKCIKERVSNVPNGWVHSRPESSASGLWELTAGSTVTYCGRWKADQRHQPIIWHWVSFKSVQEPWDHEGWMSSRILDPVAVEPQTTLPDSPVAEPQSTSPDRLAIEPQRLPDRPSPPPVEPPRSTLSDKPATPDKTPAAETPVVPSCKTDWRKCSDNADLINNYIDGGSHFDYIAKCEEAINGLSKYGSPSWAWLFPFGKFHPGTDYPKTGIVTFIDDSITFKNMFNADVHIKAVCVYDLHTNTVKSFNASKRD